MGDPPENQVIEPHELPADVPPRELPVLGHCGGEAAHRRVDSQAPRLLRRCRDGENARIREPGPRKSLVRKPSSTPRPRMSGADSDRGLLEPTPGRSKTATSEPGVRKMASTGRVPTALATSRVISQLRHSSAVRERARSWKLSLTKSDRMLDQIITSIANPNPRRSAAAFT